MNPKIVNLAAAIAKAEGFGEPGALPTRAHNPGDLKLGDIGFGTINGKTVFPHDEEGYSALYRQLIRMATGKSRYYRPTDTFERIAEIWTGLDGARAWCAIVCDELGVGPLEPLAQYMGDNW